MLLTSFFFGGGDSARKPATTVFAKATFYFIISPIPIPKAVVFTFPIFAFPLYQKF